MPIKFPYLKDTRDPLGLIEQIGVAITVHPEEDAADDPIYSWAGRLLSDDFTWSSKDKSEAVIGQGDKTNFIQAYFNNQLRYTVYDWQLTYLNIDVNKGEARGTARVKGNNGLCSQSRLCGNYEFRYTLVKDPLTQRWKLQEWVLKEI